MDSDDYDDLDTILEYSEADGNADLGNFILFYYIFWLAYFMSWFHR
jgi:hypothetical protein